MSIIKAVQTHQSHKKVTGYLYLNVQEYQTTTVCTIQKFVVSNICF